MPVITEEYVQDNWPEWETFCTLDGYDPDADPPPAPPIASPAEMLTTSLALADAELSEYVAVTSEDAPDAIKRHLLILTKKAVFDVKHGDAVYDRDPQIIRDYKQSIAILERYRKGELLLASPAATMPDEDEPRVNITSKERIFARPGNWFHD